jgi:hypothetical protein
MAMRLQLLSNLIDAPLCASANHAPDLEQVMVSGMVALKCLAHYTLVGGFNPS